MTSDGCFPEGEDYTTWKSPLIGVRALHPALLPSALWHNPLSPVVSWGACQPAASLPSLLLFRDALGKGSARPVITGYWTWVCGPPASHSLRPGLLRVMVGEGPSACADASEDSEAPNETEGQGSYVLGLSPQRPLTNLVKESADRVRSSAVGTTETDEGPLSKANRSDSLGNFRLTPSFFFFF